MGGWGGGDEQGAADWKLSAQILQRVTGNPSCEVADGGQQVLEQKAFLPAEQGWKQSPGKYITQILCYTCLCILLFTVYPIMKIVPCR